jgi:hypothetical protein
MRRTIRPHKSWDERTQHAIDEVQEVIKTAFPEAAFQVPRGDDPAGMYLDASTKAENGFDVFDVIGDRLVDLGVEASLGIHMVPLLKAEP